MHEQPRKGRLKYSREEYSDDGEHADFYLFGKIALEYISDSYFQLNPVSIYIAYSDEESKKEAQQAKERLNRSNQFISKLHIEKVDICKLWGQLQEQKRKIVWILFKANRVYQHILSQLRRKDFQNYYVRIFYLSFNMIDQQIYDEQISNGEWHKSTQLLNSAQKIQQKYKQMGCFPNFIPIGLQNVNKNIERVTLSAILNEEDNEMINNHLLGVLSYQKYIKDHVKQQLLKNLSGKNGDRNLINIYTGNHFHHLLNNFLRMTNNPKKVFYFKEIIKQMYNQIKQEYIKAKKGKQKQHISLFRGAFMSQAQIQFLRLNKGKYVQSLGFLSTSINETMATGFMKNALIKITVTHQERNEKLDHGYADISKQSEKPEEKEVLFNPLCIFRVEKVEFKESDLGKYNHIQLTYCPIEKQTEKRITAIVEYDRREVEVRNQGHIFKKIEFANERLRYWRKLAQSYKGDSQSQRIKIQQQLVEALIAKQEYEQAQQYMQKMKQAVDANPHLLKLYGDIHRGLKQNEIAKKYYIKSLQNLKLKGSNQQAFLANIDFAYRQQQFDSTSESMVQSLYSLSQIYIELGEPELARESSRNCLILSNQYCSIKNKKHLNRLLKHSSKSEKITDIDLRLSISQFLEDNSVQQKDDIINYIIRLMLTVLLGTQAGHYTKEKTEKQYRAKNIQQLFEYAQNLYTFRQESEYEVYQNGLYFYLRSLYLMEINQNELALQNLQKSLAFYQKSIRKIPEKARVYLKIAKLKIAMKITKQGPVAQLKQALLIFKANQIKTQQKNLHTIIECYRLLIELGQQDISVQELEKIITRFSTKVFTHSDQYGKILLIAATHYCKFGQFDKAKSHIDTYSRQKFENNLQFAILQSQLLTKMDSDYKGSYVTLKTALNNFHLIQKQSEKSIEEAKRLKSKGLRVLIERALQCSSEGRSPIIAEQIIYLLSEIQLQQLELNLEDIMVIKVMSAKLEALKMLDMHQQALLFLTSLTLSKSSSLRQFADQQISTIHHLIEQKQMLLSMQEHEYNL